MRHVPVDLDALEDAFENNSPDVCSYMHLLTGDTIRLVAGKTDPDTYSRMTSDPNCERVTPVSSREQFRWMTLFIEDMPHGPRREELSALLVGKGSFRRFKDALAQEERAKWLAFRSGRLRIIIDEWLTHLGITPVDRIVPSASLPERVAASLLLLSPANLASALDAVSQVRCLLCGNPKPCAYRAHRKGK